MGAMCSTGGFPPNDDTRTQTSASSRAESEMPSPHPGSAPPSSKWKGSNGSGEIGGGLQSLPVSQTGSFKVHASGLAPRTSQSSGSDDSLPSAKKAVAFSLAEKATGRGGDETEQQHQQQQQQEEEEQEGEQEGHQQRKEKGADVSKKQKRKGDLVEGDATTPGRSHAGNSSPLFLHLGFKGPFSRGPGKHHRKSEEGPSGPDAPLKHSASVGNGGGGSHGQEGGGGRQHPPGQERDRKGEGKGGEGDALPGSETAVTTSSSARGAATSAALAQGDGGKHHHGKKHRSKHTLPEGGGAGGPSLPLLGSKHRKAATVGRSVGSSGMIRTSSGGIMKVVDVLTGGGGSGSNLTDKVGQNLSMAGLSLSSTFSTRLAKGSSGRMEIVGFEVANVIVRVLNLRHSLLADDVAELQSEVLANEGVRALVSDDEYELWCIAAEDKRSELRGVAKEVARLGLMCVDTSWHNLKHDFDMLGTVEEPRAKLSKEEVEAELKNLNVLAEATAELYHELSAMTALQVAYNRRAAEELIHPTSNSVSSMRAELRAQEKSVRLLKRRALWSKRFDSIVEKLAEAIHFLHGQILEVFGTDVVKVGALITGSKPSPSDMRKLGVNGLAHHYAHLVNYLDNLAMRPQAGPDLREKLYDMILPSVRSRLKRALLDSHALEEESMYAIRERLEKTLDWLVSMAGNTLRYSGDCRLQGYTDLTLLQTLHHADQSKMEALVLDLLVVLQHLVCRSLSLSLTAGGGSTEFAPAPLPRSPLRAPLSHFGDSEVGTGEGQGGGGRANGQPRLRASRSLDAGGDHRRGAPGVIMLDVSAARSSLVGSSVPNLQLQQEQQLAGGGSPSDLPSSDDDDDDNNDDDDDDDELGEEWTIKTKTPKRKKVLWADPAAAAAGAAAAAAATAGAGAGAGPRVEGTAAGNGLQQAATDKAAAAPAMRQVAAGGGDGGGGAENGEGEASRGGRSTPPSLLPLLSEGSLTESIVSSSTAATPEPSPVGTPTAAATAATAAAARATATATTTAKSGSSSAPPSPAGTPTTAAAATAVGKQKIAAVAAASGAGSGGITAATRRRRARAAAQSCDEASLSLIARVLGTVGGSRTRTLGPMASRVGASDTDLARRREAADDVVRAEAAAARGGEGAAAVDKQAAVQRTKSLDPWDARKNLTRTGLFNPSGAAPLGSPRGILSQHGIGVGGSPAVVSPAAEPASDSPRAAAGAPAGAASPVASFGSSTRDSAVADPALLRGGPPMSPGVRNGLPSPLSRHSKRPGGNSRGSPRDTSSPRSSSGGSHAARSPSGPAPPGSPAAATAATASPTGHASGAAEAAGGAAPPAGGESAPGGSTRRSGTSLAEVRERRRARSMAKYHIMTPGGTPGNGALSGGSGVLGGRRGGAPGGGGSGVLGGGGGAGGGSVQWRNMEGTLAAHRKLLEALPGKERARIAGLMRGPGGSGSSSSSGPGGGGDIFMRSWDFDRSLPAGSLLMSLQEQQQRRPQSQSFAAAGNGGLDFGRAAALAGGMAGHAALLQRTLPASWLSGSGDGGGGGGGEVATTQRKSRTLSRSNTFSVGQVLDSPRGSIRAMVPPSLDVDGIGPEESALDVEACMSPPTLPPTPPAVPSAPHTPLVPAPPSPSTSPLHVSP